MQWRRCKVITRDFLMNADCKTAFGAIEESLLWSAEQRAGNDSNLLIVFYVQIMPDDFVMQLHRF